MRANGHYLCMFATGFDWKLVNNGPASWCYVYNSGTVLLVRFYYGGRGGVSCKSLMSSWKLCFKLAILFSIPFSTSFLKAFPKVHEPSIEICVCMYTYTCTCMSHAMSKLFELAHGLEAGSEPVLV